MSRTEIEAFRRRESAPPDGSLPPKPRSLGIEAPGGRSSPPPKSRRALSGADRRGNRLSRRFGQPLRTVCQRLRQQELAPWCTRPPPHSATLIPYSESSWPLLSSRTTFLPDTPTRYPRHHHLMPRFVYAGIVVALTPSRSWSFPTQRRAFA
jgi:hypothetical protein